MKNKAPALYVLAAGVLWGTICISVNMLSAYSVSSMEIGFLRMLVCAVCMLFALLIYKPSLLKINIKDIWMFIGTGVISLTFFNWCYFTTIVESETSVAVSLLYTSPVWVMLFSAVLFKEKITVKKVSAMVITVIGCVLITGIIGSGAQLSPKIILTGIGAGIGYALYSIFGRYATAKYNSLTITFYTFLFSAIGFAFMVKPNELIGKCTANPMIVLIAAVSGILCGVLPYIFYTIGLKRLEPSTAAVLAAVEPLVACLIGIFGYRDTVTLSKISGIIMVLASIILLGAKNGKRIKSSE